MMMNNLMVEGNHQLYSIYTPNGGTMICQVYMGNDQQYLLDAKCMEKLTRLLALRWGFIQPHSKQ